MTTELTAIRKKLEKKLKEERYIHTLGVMYTAASMAMRHGADVQKASLPIIMLSSTINCRSFA